MGKKRREEDDDGGRGENGTSKIGAVSLGERSFWQPHHATLTTRCRRRLHHMFFLEVETHILFRSREEIDLFYLLPHINYKSI